MNYQTKDNRIFGLDIIRAFAVIIVVISHGGFILKDTFLEGFPYFRMIDGVDIFFVLSGFLIGTILLKKLNNKESFKFKDLLIFWKRRWFRTLPNYYLILVANLLFVKYGFIDQDIDLFNFNFVTFTQNFSTPFYGFFWESWSLSVEEWFYIIAPILSLFAIRFFSPKKSFLIVTMTMIILPLLYRISIHNVKIDDFWWDVTYRKIVLTRLDSIGYGLFFAWSYLYYPLFWRKYKFVAALIGSILIYFILNFHQGPETLYKQTIYFSLVPISIMLFLPLALEIKRGKGIIARMIEHISLISYSMYLIHFGLIALVIMHKFPPLGSTDGLVKYFIFWFLTISISSLLYKYFELPMMNLRDKQKKS